MKRPEGCKCHREEGDSICPVHISDSELDDIQATLDGRFATTSEIVLGWLQRTVTVIRTERARADRLAKLLERSGAMLRDLMASYETSWPDRSEILARIAAALAEEEVGE